MADKVQVLSSRALETFVRDEKIAQASLTENQIGENENGQSKPLFEVKSVHVHTLELAEDVENELEKLQQKGIDINGLLREFLKKREEELEQEENEISEIALSRRSGILQRAGQKAEKCEACVDDNSNVKQKPSRYINVATRKFLNKKFGNKCSIQACIKPAEEIHHTQRWALNQNHDPHYLAPLCKQHHQIAHSIDQKYIRNRRI